MSSIADEKMREFYEKNIPNKVDYSIASNNLFVEAKKAGLLSEKKVINVTKVIDEHGNIVPEDKAMRFNDGKLNWSLVHFDSLKPLVKVLMFGAKKYAPDNWKKGLNRTEILESMFRHLTALMDGETHDPESGELHIGHIYCNAMFWTFFYNKENNNPVK